MQLNGNHFPSLFKSVRDVREALDAYCLAPGKLPVSKDDLKYAVEQVYGVKIRIFIAPLRSHMLRGKIDMFLGESKIYLDARLNSKDTRYVLAKELCHHLVCDPEYRTADPTAIIEFIVQDGVNSHREDAPHDVATEDLTKIAALELLFPRELRVAAKARLAQGDETVFALSEWLDIPEHMVELALSDWYMVFTDSVWEAV